LAHAADRDTVGQLVACAQLHSGGRPHGFNTAFVMAVAIGPAVRAPVDSLPASPPCSTTTPTATCGSSAGANAVNQACGAPPGTFSAVPVFAATCTPGIWAETAVPLSTTSSIMSVMEWAVCFEIGLP